MIAAEEPARPGSRLFSRFASSRSAANPPRAFESRYQSRSGCRNRQSNPTAPQTFALPEAEQMLRIALGSLANGVKYEKKVARIRNVSKQTDLLQ